MSQPLISVVTPFHDTAAYLAECIESVLGQTYPCFEYILVDNCSTDGSSQIAERYATRDRRIRLIRRKELLSQVQNYNRSLAEISEASQYCKIVQADDFIFPDCLRLMMQSFEQSSSIGLVSAYDVKGNMVRGTGFPFQSSPLSGKEVARLILRTGVFVFGSPTTVMYRSSLVRNCQPFYDERLLHEDTEKCMQILESWDFGFVPQVLSFLRVGNESISRTSRTFQPNSIDRYIVVERYASLFLPEAEATALRKKTKGWYYAVLAHEALRFREPAFWQYHEHGLSTLGEKIDRPYLMLRIIRELLWLAVNPGLAVERLMRSLRNSNQKRVSEPDRALRRL